MTTPVAFIVPPDHFERGRPRPTSPHTRQIAALAQALGAPIKPQPTTRGLNVSTDGIGCWKRPFTTPTAFIAHGIADKGNWLYRETDYALAPNDFIAERCGAEAFVVGWPHLDALFDGSLTPAPPGERPRVLYAPTLSRLTRGVDVPSSRTHAEDILKALEAFDVTFSDHPHHSGAGVTPLQAYLDADVIVADYGSTLHIAVGLGKPVVLAPHCGTAAPGSLEEALGHAVRRSTIETLRSRIDHAADFGRRFAEAAWRDVVIDPALRGKSLERAVEIIRALA